MTSGSSSGSTSSVQKASDTSPSASNNPVESKGVTQQDIDTELKEERAIPTVNSEVQDLDGYSPNAGEEFTYNPVTRRFDPKD